MKISIVGAGYVGLCTAVAFASRGHDVTCVDVDESKVNAINSGVMPLYEEGLDEALIHTRKKNLIRAESSIKNTPTADFIFIAVGTPSKHDGDIDLRYVENAAADVAAKIGTYTVVVVKSTVLPETTEKVVIPIIEKHSRKRAGTDFGVCMNPEFLREGRALEDFINPDRIVIGEYDKRSGDRLAELYSGFNTPIIRTNIKTAEMIKYASNAFLATKISFVNEIGNLCKKLGIDVYDVTNAMGLDKRIAPHFLQAGVGFGGSCFRKDVEALTHKSKSVNNEARVLSAVLDVNALQPMKIIDMLGQKLGDFNKKRVAILGLAFKDNTDDVRDSPSISIIRNLVDQGADIVCYDPKAENNMKKLFPQIAYAESAVDAIKNADACLVLTAWKEFGKLKDQDFDSMRQRIIIEGRRVLDRTKVRDFEGVCW